MLRKDFENLDPDDKIIGCDVEYRVMGFYKTTRYGVLFRLQTDGSVSYYYGMDAEDKVFRVTSFTGHNDELLETELVPELNQEGVLILPAMLVTARDFIGPGLSDPLWFVPNEPLSPIMN